MTKRNTGTPITTPVPFPQPNHTAPQPEANPLSAFFRKPKVRLFLPSKGKGYKANELTLEADGSLPVYPMTADDDIKFRSGDATLSGNNIYQVITSCIPGIKSPANIRHIDIDAILLAIRCATYGSQLEYVTEVPKTSLKRTLTIDALEILKPFEFGHNEWDEILEIESDSTILRVTIHPLCMSDIFTTSKTIYKERKNLSTFTNVDDEISDESKYRSSIQELTNSALNMICSSVSNISVITNGITTLDITANSPVEKSQISNLLRKMDVAYFNEIKYHIERQKNKFTLMVTDIISTPEELVAGAPKSWNAELTFLGSNFLPEKTTIS